MPNIIAPIDAPINNMVYVRNSPWINYFASVNDALSNVYPPMYASDNAPLNCIFYNISTAKLSYKDPAGIVHDLY